MKVNLLPLKETFEYDFSSIYEPLSSFMRIILHTYLFYYQRRELELGEMQRKLDLANNAFSETIETRNARIRELESRISQKQNEVS